MILLTASYKNQEFVRIGYYVNTEYADEELRQQDPQPDPPLLDKLVRVVAADKPRVTRFNINWSVMLFTHYISWLSKTGLKEEFETDLCLSNMIRNDTPSANASAPAPAPVAAS